jgi:hypothetical protein
MSKCDPQVRVFVVVCDKFCIFMQMYENSKHMARVQWPRKSDLEIINIDHCLILLIHGRSFFRGTLQQTSNAPRRLKN